MGVAKLFYALSGFAWAAVVKAVAVGMPTMTLLMTLFALAMWRVGDLALKDAR